MFILSIFYFLQCPANVCQSVLVTGLEAGISRQSAARLPRVASVISDTLLLRAAITFLDCRASRCAASRRLHDCFRCRRCRFRFLFREFQFVL